VLSRQLNERDPLSPAEANACLMVGGKDGRTSSTSGMAAALSEALSALPNPTPANENKGEDGRGPLA